MKSSPKLQQAAKKEMAIRELEKRFEPERTNFQRYCQTLFKKELKKDFVWNWHHNLIGMQMQDLMNDEFDLLIINIPPRHTKTEEVTKLFPTWWLGNNPSYNFISTGYSSTLTQTFSGEARDYYQSQTYGMMFPRKSPIKKDQNTKEYWKNKEGGFYYATGAGGTITGKGGDLIIIDDPSNPNDAESSSKTNLNAINTWFSNVILSRRNTRIVDGKKVTGKIAIIMQRIHDNDLCGYIMREYDEFFKSGRWRKLVIPAIATEDEKFRKKGEALFPQMYDIDFLNDQKIAMSKKMGTNHFSAQYQQTPIDKANAEFKRDYIQYKTTDEIQGLVKAGVIAVDPAESEKQSADYRAITVWGRGLAGHYYKMHEEYGRWSTSEFIDKIMAIQYAYGYSVVVETNKSKLIKDVIKRAMKDKDQFFVLQELINIGNKEERIRVTLQPLYENYQIFHDKKLSYGEGEDELTSFPKSANDDIIDADEMAVRSLGKKEVRRPQKNRIVKKMLAKQESNDKAYN